MTAPMTMRQSASASEAKYDLNVNPVYQIDMTTASTGKMVAQTKRRVRWRFGFSNKAAIQDGAKGTDCRGEEHEVSLIWSLTSGKRLVLMDGKEVHFSMGKPTSGKFQTSWTMRGNHVLKIVAYAAPPIKNRPGFRQFELFLDGMSFFSFPRIYELGIKAGGGHVRGMVEYEGARGSGGQQPYNNYSLPPEEENAWARRVEAFEERRSMDRVPTEVTTPSSAAPTTQEHSFASPPPAAPTATPAGADLMSDPISTPGQDLFDQPNALLDTSTPTIGAGGAPQPDFDFTPQAPPPATYNDVAGSVLGLYGGPAPAPDAAAALPALPPSTSAPVEQQQQYYAQTPQAQVQAPPQQQQQQPVQQQYYQEPAPQQQFASPPQQQYYQQPAPQQQQQYDQQYQQPPQQQYAEQQMVTPAKFATPVDSNAENNNAQEQQIVAPANDSPQGVADLDAPVDDVSRALKNLVNFDDINEKPVNDELSMYTNAFADKNELRDDQRKVSKKGKPKSKGLPPTSKDYNMTGRSLKEVKELHGGEVRKPPTKEVMKTHAFDPAAAAAGMMVVYGAPGQQPVAQQAYGNYQVPQQQQYYAAQQQAPQHDYSQGPPPIAPAAGTGFGIGAVLPGGGYGAPQQQQVYASR